MKMRTILSKRRNGSLSQYKIDFFSLVIYYLRFIIVINGIVNETTTTTTNTRTLNIKYLRTTIFFDIKSNTSN